MTLADALLPEFDREMSTSRRVLERVPEDHLTWKPHPKSMSLGELSTHVANLPKWASLITVQSEFDVSGSDSPRAVTSRAELLQRFDSAIAEARASLVGRTNAELLGPWTLKHAGHEVFTMPKAAALRGFFLNHLIHHRGQLTVYLRLRDVPVPPIYGPTADERA